MAAGGDFQRLASPSSEEQIMDRRCFFVAACALAGTAFAQSPGPGGDKGPAALGLRLHEAHAARVAVLPGPAEAIRVTFEPAEWPSVRFPAPRERAWDWSGRGFLLLDLTNPGREPLNLGIRIDDDPSADGRLHCRTAQVALGARESATVAVALAPADPMTHGMRGLPAYPGTRGVGASGQGPFRWSHVFAFQVFMHRPATERSVEIRAARLAPPISLEGIVDALGQYAGGSWPGKVLSESELAQRHEQEARDLATHPAPADRDRFGGWKSGAKLPGSGFFRTALHQGKWWLVDPDGALFVSLGIDVVSPHEATMVTGRETMFQGLPRPGDPLARHFGMAFEVHSGPVKSGKTFNFYAANLERIYGPHHAEMWKESTLNRLPSWGFNTIGNWSDERLYRNGKVPYVATAGIRGGHARLSSGSDYWGTMHDPFDPRFVESVRASLRGVTARIKGDPWCLGTFVDNELSWGGFGDEGGRIGLGLGALKEAAEKSPAKRALIDQLRKKYGEIVRLNDAWKTPLRDWQELETPWQPAPYHVPRTEAFRADLRAFVKELARAYFRTVRDELKKADPDHLYLGCRFAWRTEEAVAASAEFCDVVSFNIYDRRVDPRKWAFLNALNRPVIIGEFHAGALDRGMFHTGLVSTADQAERAAIYADYVGSVLDSPALVGCHWFQYVDEPLTGRSFDGENYNIGFLTVTDTPYPELVAAARKVHAEAYARRAGAPAGR
jgi:hypothetical protein